MVGEDDVKGLRSVYDKIETHFRGLEAMVVDKATYSSFIMPVIMGKFAKPIRMNLIRYGRKGHLTWSMVDLLDALKQELEIIESDVPLLQNLAIRSEPKLLDSQRKTGLNWSRTQQVPCMQTNRSLDVLSAVANTMRKIARR